jgi:hypothetical protein
MHEQILVVNCYRFHPALLENPHYKDMFRDLAVLENPPHKEVSGPAGGFRGGGEGGVGWWARGGAVENELSWFGTFGIKHTGGEEH